MDNRIIVDKLEFYITNVCNLTCSGCNRYNNYKFSGWQDYDDYAEVIKEWAKKIKVIKPVILGGEPLLNPTINKWIEGIREAWPDSYAPEIISNGARIDQVKGLYDTLVKTHSWIGISVHSEETREHIYNRIRNFLKAPIQEGTNLKDGMDSAYQFIDANYVQVRIWNTTDFIQNNVIEYADGRKTFYNSDPVLAHDACPFVLHKNYHMIKGKFYKCGPVALMPEFDEQYPMDISDDDRALLKAGYGLSINEFDEKGAEFFRNLDNPIPQCKFCPESFEWHKIEFTDLKPNKI